MTQSNRRTSIVTSVATLAIACAATADFTGMETEVTLVDQSSWVGSDARTLYVVSVYAVFDTATDKLISVFGDGDHVLSVETSDTSGFYQFNADGTGTNDDYNTSDDISSGIVSVYPSAASDSFVTIGLTDDTDNELINVGVDYDSFNDESATSALSVDNGAWFITPSDTQGTAGNYTDNRVLIGQFTVGAGETVSGSVSLMWNDAAEDSHFEYLNAFEGMAAVGGINQIDFNGDGKTDLV